MDPSHFRRLSAVVTILMMGLSAAPLQGQDAASSPPGDGQPVGPPTDFTAEDVPWDGGEAVRLTWTLSPDDATTVDGYLVYREKTDKEIENDQADDRKKTIKLAMDAAAASLQGEAWAENLSGLSPENRRLVREARTAARTEVAQTFDDGVAAETDVDRFKLLDNVPAGNRTYVVTRLEPGRDYRYMIEALSKTGVKSTAVITGPVAPVLQWFDSGRLYLAIILLIICGSVVYWIYHARSGRPIKVRKIAGLEAVDEAVGRATEMGRSVLYVPGIQDINEIQTIASMTILARVAKTAAEYDAKVEVPTARSLVMTTARETVQAAFLAAGRPDAYNKDLIHYVTDEQFGYVAYLSGMMVREKPAACFYMGAFFAESLILAETGNSIGAIQVAGTAMPAQLPFFVAACDYTLIGEEFFAASAYLSGSAEELGSLKGQDVGKVVVAVLLLIGVAMYTTASVIGPEAGFGEQVMGWVDFLRGTILN